MKRREGEGRLLGDAIDARRHELCQLVRVETAKDLLHIEKLGRHHVGYCAHAPPLNINLSLSLSLSLYLSLSLSLTPNLTRALRWAITAALAGTIPCHPIHPSGWLG